MNTIFCHFTKEQKKQLAYKGLDYLKRKVAYNRNRLRRNSIEGLLAIHESRFKDYKSYLDTLNAEQLNAEVMQTEGTLAFELNAYEEAAQMVARDRPFISIFDKGPSEIDKEVPLGLVDELVQTYFAIEFEYGGARSFVADVKDIFRHLCSMSRYEASKALEDPIWKNLISAFNLEPILSSDNESVIKNRAHFNLITMETKLNELNEKEFKESSFFFEEIEALNRLADEFGYRSGYRNHDFEEYNRALVEKSYFRGYGFGRVQEILKRIQVRGAEISGELESRSGEELVTYLIDNINLFADIFVPTELGKVMKASTITQLTPIHPLRAEYLKNVLLSHLGKIMAECNPSALPIDGISRLFVKKALFLAEAFGVRGQLSVREVLEVPQE